MDFFTTELSLEKPVRVTTDPIDRPIMSFNKIIPDNPTKSYDMKHIIEKIVDEGDFMEMKKDFAKNIIIGFGRFDGKTVGIVCKSTDSNSWVFRL